MLNVGDRAPDFIARDQNDEPRSLTDYKGQWILLYFYPKDDTPGCTKEACAIRDTWGELQQEDVVVLGVSADPVNSHRQFAATYNLPFLLLSDPERDILLPYEAIKKEDVQGHQFEKIQRVSYLIDPDGVIVKTYDQIEPGAHAQEVLADVQELKIKA